MTAKRIACIDYGLKRIGIAISDESKIIARALDTLVGAKTVQARAEGVAIALQPYAIETIVVGLPLHLNGREGDLVGQIRHFMALLQTKMGCPVIAWEERLSTCQAEKSLLEAGLSRKKRAQLIDGVTAVILLQSYLEFKMIPV